MITLRIEHQISGLDLWLGAFEPFAAVRAQAGVRAERLCQPVDDAGRISLDLDFDDVAAAQAFESFLRNEVWASPSASPALVGAPATQLLIAVDRAPVPSAPEHR